MIATGEVLAKRLRAGDVDGAKRELSAMPAVEAEILNDALDYYADGPDSFQEIVQKGIRQRRKVFESGLCFWAPWAATRPSSVCSVPCSALSRPSRNWALRRPTWRPPGGGMGNVMGGIAEALIATAVGILVAIPAVIAYNLFQKKCNDIEENTGALANQVLAVMKSTKNPTNSTRRRAPAMDDIGESPRLRPAEVNG